MCEEKLTVKEKVLYFLKNSADYVSGQALATQLSCTRAAVWKAIKCLTDDGYKIEGINNRGYKLQSDSDVLSSSGITRLLDSNCNVSVTVLESVDSTNTYLNAKAVGLAEGAAVVAAHQTNGRGRLGRSFYSPDNSGVYISLLLRPKCNSEQISLITTAAAVAVCRAIESVSSVSAQIKWVNDVFINNKKVCGILTEAVFNMEGGGVEHAVLGVGINITTPEGGFKQLDNIATALQPTSMFDIRNRVCAAFFNQFTKIYNGGQGLTKGAPFISEYRERLFMLNMPVQVISASNVRNAIAIDIDDMCRLIVRFDNGQQEVLASGEISVKPLK